MRTLMLLMSLIITTQAPSQDSDQPADTSPHSEEQRQSMHCIIGVVHSIMLIGQDDALLPEFQALLDEEADIDLENNGFVYLWGMDQLTDDPYARGVHLLQQIADADAAYLSGKDEYDDAFLRANPSIEFQYADDHCRYHEPGCLPRVLADLAAVPAYTDHDELVLQRYLKLQAFTQYQPKAWTTWVSPIPPYRMLSTGQHLLHLELLQSLQQNDPQAFMTGMQNNIQFIKHSLRQETTLIGKMVFNNLLALNYELLSQLLQLDLISTEAAAWPQLLEPLTDRALSIRSTLKGELLFVARGIQELARDPAYLKTGMAVPGDEWWLSFMMPLLLQPNMSINQYHNKVFQPLMTIDLTQPKTFYQATQQSIPEWESDYIRNPLGSWLHNLGNNPTSHFYQVQARLHHTNMKNQLLRAYLEQGSFEQVVELAEQGHRAYLNPMNDTPPSLTERHICYPTDFDLMQYHHCLLILPSKSDP